jgi:endogenous inhibitor of DNA gyrase (YacG/DUF329 family)
MIVKCALCGADVERANPTTHNFCCVEHRNEWMRQNVDFAELARGHKAKHLTALNNRRNKLCHIADRGKADSHRARLAAAEYLGRPLLPGEVVHHMNGSAVDNRGRNLLIMTDRQHKQLHMALAIEQLEEGEADDM